MQTAYLTYVQTGRYPMSDMLTPAFLTWVVTGRANWEVSDMLADMDENPDMPMEARFALFDFIMCAE